MSSAAARRRASSSTLPPIVFAASASFNIAASRFVGDSAASCAAPVTGEPSDFASSSIRCTLAVGVGVEVRSGKRLGPPCEDCFERGRKAIVERGGALAVDSARGDFLLKLPAQRAHSRGKVVRCGLR